MGLCKLRVLLWCAALLVACSRRTEYCESDDDCSAEAVCDLRSHLCSSPTLNVVVTGDGRGRVLSEPPGIDCPGKCSASFEKGRRISLKMSLDADSFQGGWSGACAGDPCEVTVDRNIEVGARIRAKVCSIGGFCWDNPLPQSGVLQAVWGTGPSDVWAVAQTGNERPRGAILHWDGLRWSVSPGTEDAWLFGVWGSGPRDVWVTGVRQGSIGQIFHFDGSAWSLAYEDAGGFLYGIWGSGPKDIWAIGAPGAIHFDGERWSRVNDAKGFAVWGSGPSDVWTGGAGGKPWHFDGASWKQFESPTTNELRGIWGSGPSDVWISGKGGTMLHFDGNQISSVPAISSGPLPDIGSVWGTGPRDVWAATSATAGGTVLRFDGTKWSTVHQQREPLTALWGSGGSDVWAVGYRLTAAHWDGQTFAPVPTSVSRRDLVDVWGSGPGDLWAVGDGGTILHSDGNTWSTDVKTERPLCGLIRGIWGSGRSDVWAVGGGAGCADFLLRWDGTKWSPAALPAGLSTAGLRLSGVWGSGPKDVWAVGETSGSAGVIIRLGADGRWNVVSTGMATDRLYGVGGSGPNDVWVGGARALLHFKGGTWTSDSSVGNAYLYRFFAPSANEAWAVGGHPPSGSQIIMAWNGSAWQVEQNLPGRQDLVQYNHVWGSGAGDIWAVGPGGTILRRSAGSWSQVSSGTDIQLIGVWGTGTGQVLAVGENGTILRRGL